MRLFFSTSRCCLNLRHYEIIVCYFKRYFVLRLFGVHINKAHSFFTYLPYILLIIILSYKESKRSDPEWDLCHLWQQFMKSLTIQPPCASEIRPNCLQLCTPSLSQITKSPFRFILFQTTSLVCYSINLCQFSVCAMKKKSSVCFDFPQILMNVLKIFVLSSV